MPPVAATTPRPTRWTWLGQERDSPLGERGPLVVRAIADRLRLDAQCVRVFVLSEPELMHYFHGRHGRIDWNAELGGFHYASLLARSSVFVKRERTGVSPTVLVHEALHALSPRFTEQAGNRRTSLVEGITQYFTRDVVMLELGITDDRWLDAYPDGVAVADRLARLLGQRTLANAFFHAGMPELTRAVDARLGRTGGLARAAFALAAGDVEGALAELEP
jgi:hypothetical protein